jgi:23S rRNA (guanosine2251-2'-O)-methyltransferase
MKDDFIFGLRPVIEAIEAGKTIDKIFVQNAFRVLFMLNLKRF